MATPAKPPPTASGHASSIIAEALESSDRDLRIDALTALGLAGTGDSRAKLLEALKDKDGHIRFGAARGLKLLRDPGTASAIEEAWDREEGWAVKKELAGAAAIVGARKLIPKLKKDLDSDREDVRVTIAWALSDLGDRAGEEILARSGNPPRPNTHKEGVDRWSRKVLIGKREGDPRLAARTLAELGTPADRVIFEARLTDADPYVRLWAAAGLLRLER